MATFAGVFDVSMKSLRVAIDALLGGGAGPAAGDGDGADTAGTGACACLGAAECHCDPEGGQTRDATADVAAMVAGASVEQVGEWLVQVQRCIDVLGGVHAQLGAVFEAAGGPQLAGCSSFGMWSRRLRLSGAEVRARAHAAAALASLGQVRAAARAGRLRPEHVVEFGRGCDKVGEQIMGRAQEALLPVARDCDPAVLRHAIDQLRATVRPDDPDADWVKAQTRQDLTCTRVGYGYQVRGLLDADTGAMLATVLAIWTRPHLSTRRLVDPKGAGDHDNPADGGPDSAAPGRAVSAGVVDAAVADRGGVAGRDVADGDDRPVARRRVEGFKTLLRACLSAGLPTDKGIRPHLNVTVDLATLRLAAGADRSSASTPATLDGYGVCAATCSHAWHATPRSASS